MNPRLRIVLVAVALLGFIWAQPPATPVWAAPVAYAASAKADNFAWDNPVFREDGVGDSPLVP